MLALLSPGACGTRAASSGERVSQLFVEASKIVRAVSGTTCAEFLRQEIFERLEMTETSLGARPGTHVRIATTSMGNRVGAHKIASRGGQNYTLDALKTI